VSNHRFVNIASYTDSTALIIVPDDTSEDELQALESLYHYRGQSIITVTEARGLIARLTSEVSKLA
jgi:hypothetical protein